MKYLMIVILSVSLQLASDQSKTNNTDELNNEKQEQVSANVALVKNGMDALFQDFDEKATRKYFKADYIQHNPHVPTGLEAVIGLLPALKEANFGYTTHRYIEDGDLVLTHTTYHNAEVFGANKVVAFDIWRIEDGKIAEHWDSIIPLYKETASGRTQTEGATEIVDKEKTAANKKLVRSFVQEVLIGEKLTKMRDYLNSQEIYDQHNPVVGDGPDALAKAMGSIKNNKIHRIIGEGNFVLSQSEGTLDGKPLAIYDLFRVSNGYIVEHWDVLQEIPAKMAHSNSMF
ncbi:MAG: nuclear transport factor 2 family protein [Bacteroidota bacterium]